VDGAPGARLRVAPGPATVTVGRCGFATVTREVDLPPGERVELTIDLAPVRGRLLGRIVDATSGLPLEGATLATGLHEARSQADGAFDLRLEVGEASIDVRAPGYCRDVFTANVSEAPASRQVTLQRAATVELRLVNPRGALVAGEVGIDGSFSAQPLLRTHVWHVEYARGRLTEARDDRCLMRGETDEAGVLRVELPPGRYRARSADRTAWYAYDDGWVDVDARVGEVTTVTLQRPW
jgi:hypothetical protein